MLRSLYVRFLRWVLGPMMGEIEGQLLCISMEVAASRAEVEALTKTVDAIDAASVRAG